LGFDERVRSEFPQDQTCQCYLQLVLLGALGCLTSGP
jgi:hypothetical protein